MNIDNKAWELLMAAINDIKRAVADNHRETREFRKEVNGRIFKLEKWKWKVMGGAAVVSALIGVVVHYLK